MVIDSVFFQTKVFELYKELNLLPDKYGAIQSHSKLFLYLNLQITYIKFQNLEDGNYINFIGF